MPGAGVALAVLAAFMFAGSAALQQSAARSAALAAPVRIGWLRVLGLLRTLVRDKRWLAGWAANIGGFGLHATALHLGSIGVVQSMMVLQLFFALPMAAVRHNRRPLRRDWIGTGLVGAGLVTLVAQGMPHGPVRRDTLPVAATIALLGIGLLVVAARFVRGHAQTRAALMGVAAGLCFCCTAVLVVLTTAELPHIGWPLPCIALSTMTGGLLAQEAFASGSLPTALTAMNITDPVASYVAGALLFDVAVHPDPFGLGLAGALVATGVAVLANSPTLHDERRTLVPV